MDKEKFVLCVCGGRDYQDKDKVFSTLDRVNAKRRIDVLVQGECPTGADLFAKQWAKERGVQHFGFLANWREFGKRAGPMRNQQMVDFGLGGVIAFAGGHGTADMVRRAKQAGVTVMLVN